jgi:hypothetical protein
LKVDALGTTSSERYIKDFGESRDNRSRVGSFGDKVQVDEILSDLGVIPIDKMHDCVLIQTRKCENPGHWVNVQQRRKGTISDINSARKWQC